MSVEALGDTINGDSIMCLLRTMEPSDTDPDYEQEFAAGAAADASSLKKGNVRCGFESGVLMKPLDGGARVEVTMLTRIDLKIPLLPNWIFDMISKKMAPNTIPMLAKQAAMVAKGGSLEHLWEDKEYAGIKEGVIKRLQVLHTVDSSKL
mmetsp:Transcript_29649/g.94346  ORF Transcript_29649/g.94346 Transcript_29649/m.94346 type:complete len:150 (-) Transcript_29649:167-616(-)